MYSNRPALSPSLYRLSYHDRSRLYRLRMRMKGREQHKVKVVPVVLHHEDVRSRRNWLVPDKQQIFRISKRIILNFLCEMYCFLSNRAYLYFCVLWRNVTGQKALFLATWIIRLLLAAVTLTNEIVRNESIKDIDIYSWRTALCMG